MRRLIFGGQGDQFPHTKFMEIMEATRRAGIGTSIITGGNYFNSEKVRKLVEPGTDHIDVSVQAATPETYKKVHPTLPDGTFARIKGSLQLPAELKKKMD